MARRGSLRGPVDQCDVPIAGKTGSPLPAQLCAADLGRCDFPSTTRRAGLALGRLYLHGARAGNLATSEALADQCAIPSAQVPPFLAYWGVAVSDKATVSEAYNQIKLYRSHLKSDSGAWKHIVLGDGPDAGLWNTGNGWAAHGSLRVLATMKNSQWGDDFADEIADLTSWVQEILDAAFQQTKVSVYPGPDPHSSILRTPAPRLTLPHTCATQSDGLLPNYYDSASQSYFSDASGSALLAASAYRLAQLTGDTSFVSEADSVRTAVFAAVDPATGWLAPVVNPLSFKARASQSPEGEAFVLLLQAAYRDYVSALSSARIGSARVE